jgi:hypothetical protein
MAAAVSPATRSPRRRLADSRDPRPGRSARPDTTNARRRRPPGCSAALGTTDPRVDPPVDYDDWSVDVQAGEHARDGHPGRSLPRARRSRAPLARNPSPGRRQQGAGPVVTNCSRRRPRACSHREWRSESASDGTTLTLWCRNSDGTGFALIPRGSDVTSSGNSRQILTMRSTPYSRLSAARRAID